VDTPPRLTRFTGISRPRLRRRALKVDAGAAHASSSSRRPARSARPHAAARSCGGRCRGVQRTLASQRQQQGKERRRLEKKAAEGERRVARLTLAIADGGRSFAEIRVVLSAQVAERDACLRACVHSSTSRPSRRWS